MKTGTHYHIARLANEVYSTHDPESGGVRLSWAFAPEVTPYYARGYALDGVACALSGIRASVLTLMINLNRSCKMFKKSICILIVGISSQVVLAAPTPKLEDSVAPSTTEQASPAIPVSNGAGMPAGDPTWTPEKRALFLKKLEYMSPQDLHAMKEMMQLRRDKLITSLRKMTPVEQEEFFKKNPRYAPLKAEIGLRAN